MIEIFLGLSPILLIACIFYYFLNLHKALLESPEECRPINGWFVWLGMLPIIGIIWNMFMSVLISLNIRRQCLNHNISCYGAILFPFGLLASVFVGSATLPGVGPGLALFSAPLWILYMIVIASYRRRLNAARRHHYTKDEIAAFPANVVETKIQIGKVHKLQRFFLHLLGKIVNLIRNYSFRICLIMIAVFVAAYFIYDFRHAIWQDSGLWVEPTERIKALESDRVFYRNLVLLMVPLAFVCWIWSSKKKNVILFLRKFRQIDVNRTLQYTIRRTMFHRFRLLTLDDATFHPIASNRGQKILIIVVVIVAMAALFSTFGTIRVYLEDGLRGFAQVEGLLQQSALQLMLFPQYIIQEPELLGKMIDQFKLIQLKEIPMYYKEEMEMLSFFIFGFGTLYFGLGVFLAIIATFYLVALVRLRMIGRTHIENTMELRRFVQHAKRLKNRLSAPGIIAPLATVVAVETPYWQGAVLKLADIADTVLFDISDYTENIEWELLQMLDRHRDKCVFIAQQQQFTKWTDKAEHSKEHKLRALVQSVKIAKPIIYERLEKLDLPKLSAVLEKRLVREIYGS